MEGVVSLAVVKALSFRHRVEKCVYSTDGKRMAACLGDFSLRIYEIADCACDNESPAHADKPGSPALSSLQNLCILKGHSSNVWSIKFSQDSLLLCSCSSDRTVRVWHLEKQKSFFTFTQHSDIVWCCSFVPYHPNLVASGSSDKTVKIWNYSTGETVHDLKLYTDAVETLSFSRDGTKLCTGSRDGMVVLWSNISPEVDVAPSHLVLYQTKEWIRFVCFSEYDSDLLTTSGSSNVVLVWDLSDIAPTDITESPAETSDSTPIRTVRFAESADENVHVHIQKPKLELQGHLNTVWDSCFAAISHSDNEVRNFIISCSGDRSLRYRESLPHDQLVKE